MQSNLTGAEHRIDATPPVEVQFLFGSKIDPLASLGTIFLRVMLVIQNKWSCEQYVLNYQTGQYQQSPLPCKLRFKRYTLKVSIKDQTVEHIDQTSWMENFGSCTHIRKVQAKAWKAPRRPGIQVLSSSMPQTLTIERRIVTKMNSEVSWRGMMLSSKLISKDTEKQRRE